MAVKTTRTVRRGLERERKVESWRRKEWAGWEAATVVRMSEAFWGRVSSSAVVVVVVVVVVSDEAVAAAAAAAFLAACLRR